MDKLLLYPSDFTSEIVASWDGACHCEDCQPSTGTGKDRVEAALDLYDFVEDSQLTDGQLKAFKEALTPAEYFKFLRCGLDLSFEQCAEKLDISANTIQKWERTFGKKAGLNPHPAAIIVMELIFMGEISDIHRILNLRESS